MKIIFPGLFLTPMTSSPADASRREAWNGRFADGEGMTRRDLPIALSRFFREKDRLLGATGAGTASEAAALRDLLHREAPEYWALTMKVSRGIARVRESPYDEAACDEEIAHLLELADKMRRLRMLRVFVAAGAGPDFELPEGEELERALAVAEVHSS